MSEQTEAARVSLAALVAAAGTGATGNFAGVIVGAVTQTAGSMVFTQGSGVTFGLSASTLTASVAAGATATGNLGAISAGAASVGAGTVVFSNSNGVSFGVNGSTVTASHNGLTAETQTFMGGLAASSQSALTVTANTVNFSNANGVSFGLNSGTASSVMTASVGSGATATGNFGAVAAVGATATSGTVSFSNSNGVSFGMNGQTVTASVAAGATATGNVGALAAVGATATSGTVSFSNSNGVSFGMNGQTITASVAAAAAATLSLWAPFDGPFGFNINMGTYHNNPYMFQLGPTPVPGNMTINTFNMLLAGISNGVSYTAHTFGLSVGLYTLNNSTRLSLLNSASFSWGSNASSSDGFAQYMAGHRMLSLHSSLWSAQPVLSQTNYWLGIMFSTAGSAYMSFRAKQGMISDGGAVYAGYFGVSSSNSMGDAYPFHGFYSATSAALPTVINRGDCGGVFQSSLGANGAGLIPYVLLQNGVGSV